MLKPILFFLVPFSICLILIWIVIFLAPFKDDLLSILLVIFITLSGGFSIINGVDLIGALLEYRANYK